jgi:hypothetical protein
MVEAAKSESETRLFLLVLGNAGSVQALPVIKRHLSDHSPALRAAAVTALRFVDSRDTEDLSVSALSSDPDAEVRAKAVFSLSYRQMNPTTFGAQKKAFETDQDLGVRLSLLENLWKSRQAFSEVVEIVKRAAENDASKEVRQAAGRLLPDDKRAQ